MGNSSVFHKVLKELYTCANIKQCCFTNIHYVKSVIKALGKYQIYTYCVFLSDILCLVVNSGKAAAELGLNMSMLTPRVVYGETDNA